jgi:tetratricopeptide (TPR) repeat protein
MRLVLWGLLVFVVCLPLAFVLLIVAAARYPAMDGFTTKLPAAVGATVAELILRNAGYAKDSAPLADRAIRLDPENADGWTRRCHGNGDDTKYDQAACRKAISLDPSAWNYGGLGTTQENAKDYCAAEDSYTDAIKVTANHANALRDMARAALRCGHEGAAVAGFEVAEGLDAKTVAEDQDHDEGLKADLLADREYLAVAYDRTNQPQKAIAICTKAHPEWKTCNCELTDTAVKCSAAIAASKK